VLLVLLVVTLLVPVAEEAFFRGFAYRLLRARWGALAALAITSVGFALVHGLDPGAWLPVLPIGMILGGLAERSRSLLPPVVAHGVVNGLAIVAG
jgi:membrane protease YdiL (CAAX protease family)